MKVKARNVGGGMLDEKMQREADRLLAQIVRVD